jgi:hypothetical protein
MSIKLNSNYHQGLLSARPTFIGSSRVKPPPGAMGEERIEPAQIIPPVNTDIDYSMLSPFRLSSHQGLSALSEEPLEKIFNWRDGPYDAAKGEFNPDPELRSRMRLIATPGNQMLCGSCWAISTAGIVADSFVISGVVDWKPNLSTTYSLACYPQAKCRGGNPAKLLLDISRGGIASDHCVDYSWCEKNQWCNGDALNHFKEQHENSPHHDLNTLIPDCGCYDTGKFWRYMVDVDPPPQRVGMDKDGGGMSKEKLSRVIKAHIRHKGPVLGSFLVFDNFMKGYFTKGKSNKGIYLENAVYGVNGTVTYKKLDTQTYKGSHAVAVMGWGVEKDVQVDISGKKQDVPYWFVRNSWTATWGDKGYFKMAMYPVNKLSQFDKQVLLETPTVRVQAGGMVIFRTSKAPTKVDFKQIESEFASKPRSHPAAYYNHDTKDRPPPVSGGNGNGNVHEDGHKVKKGSHALDNVGLVGAVVGSLALIAFVFVLGYLDGKKKPKVVQKILICTIVVLTLVVMVLATRVAVKNHCKRCKARGSESEA